MSVYLLTSGSIQRAITIDGVDFPISFQSLTVDPAPIETPVDTIDGGSVSFRPLALPGCPDMSDRYTINVPSSNLTGAPLIQLERIRARGGYHTLAYWRPIRTFYTAKAGQTKFYLPRYRTNAPQVHAGLIDHGITMSTTVAPLLAWLNGTPLTVTYAAGPTLVAPAAGAIVVSQAVETTGPGTNYAPFLVGSVLVAGDVIEIEWFPLFLMTLTGPKISYPRTVVEDHSYTFRER